MKNVTPTLWNNRLQNIRSKGLRYKHLPFTTINERLNIRAEEMVAVTDMPELSVLICGNGGHGHRTGSNGFPLSRRIPHLPTHSALYNQLPLVIRTPDQDLSQAERRRYCLRTTEEFGGINYVCYYGRWVAIDKEQDVGLHHTTIENNIKTSVEYVPGNDNLYPPVPDLPNEGAVATSKEYVTTSTVIDLSFTRSDVEEALNVARIIYGDEDYAVLSEFGICNAVRRTISITTPQGNSNFEEAVHCSVAFFSAAKYELQFQRNGFNYMIEVGASEPLLGTEQIGTVTIIAP